MTDTNFGDLTEAALRAGRLEAARSFEKADGGRVLLIPDGYTPLDLPPLSPVLERIVMDVRADEQASFCGYVNRFKQDSTTVFVDSTGALTVVALLDYHNPGDPQHIRHRVTYSPAYAEEWRIWTSTGPMKQAAFAEFIEENRNDIREPAAALLLDIVTKFKATKKSDYDSVVYQPDGSVMVAWSDKVENAAGKGVPVPTELKLGIPVFFKGEKYEVPVFLRYRLNDGVLTFHLKLDRKKLIEQHAIDQIVTAIATEIPDVQVLYGVASKVR